jgi:hypothetical protein
MLKLFTKSTYFLLFGVKSEQSSWGKIVSSLLGENTSSTLGLNLNLFFLPQEVLFTHGKKFLRLKKQV